MANEAPAKDTDRYWEEIEIGESFEIEDARTITEADIVNFAGVVDDFHPIHLSERFASEQTMFDGRIAHGNFIASVSEAIIIEENHRSFSYGHDNIRFVNPVYIGDTISVSREVIKKEEYDTEYGKIVYRYETTTQDGEVVCVNDHIMIIERQSTTKTNS